MCQHHHNHQHHRTRHHPSCFDVAGKLPPVPTINSPQLAVKLHRAEAPSDPQIQLRERNLVVSFVKIYIPHSISSSKAQAPKHHHQRPPGRNCYFLWHKTKSLLINVIYWIIAPWWIPSYRHHYHHSTSFTISLQYTICPRITALRQNFNSECE